LAVNLAKAPPEDLLRTLFEVVQLSIQVHDEGEHATMTITLPADQVRKAAGAAGRIGDQMNPQGTPEGRARGVLDRAPGAVHAATSRGQRCRGCRFTVRSRSSDVVEVVPHDVVEGGQ
jgi:hypothetical protein